LESRCRQLKCEEEGRALPSVFLGQQVGKACSLVHFGKAGAPAGHDRSEEGSEDFGEEKAGTPRLDFRRRRVCYKPLETCKPSIKAKREDESR